MQTVSFQRMPKHDPDMEKIIHFAIPDVVNDPLMKYNGQCRSGISRAPEIICH